MGQQATQGPFQVSNPLRACTLPLRARARLADRVANGRTTVSVARQRDTDPDVEEERHSAIRCGAARCSDETADRPSQGFAVPGVWSRSSKSSGCSSMIACSIANWASMRPGWALESQLTDAAAASRS